ncbi:hypothetical protein PENTCL1PPCAC_30767, partial [Pristionchus entomophagus]
PPPICCVNCRMSSATYADVEEPEAMHEQGPPGACWTGAQLQSRPMSVEEQPQTGPAIGRHEHCLITGPCGLSGGSIDKEKRRRGRRG